MDLNNSSLNGMIESAMKDPRFAEILSVLREKSEKGELDVASALSEISEGTDNGDKNEESTSSKKDNSSPARSLDFKKHRQLIAALRPYLSDGKKDAVDNILKIGDMSSAFEAVMKLKDK